MQFVPLHNHSEYSALDGISTPTEIVERAKELGCPCCGMTDHQTVAGHLEFVKACAKGGIKPVLGCELYHGVKPPGFSGWTRNERDQAHLVVGALTSEGLRNLWRLVDYASTNFRYVGRVNWDVLKRYNEGLFCTSACIQGLVPQGIANSDLSALTAYQEIFGDRFYIELHTYPGPDQEQMNQALVQVAQERGIGVVYANDAHFAFPGQYSFHDAYIAMQTGQTVDTPLKDRKMWHPLALYMMDEAEIRDSLHYLPTAIVDEALSNTVSIADKVDVSLPEVTRHLPVFIPGDSPYTRVEQKSDSPQKVFIDLVEEGLIARYGKDAPDDVWVRAQREMSVFLNAGLEHYFLQTWDFCEYCNVNGITRGPGRGSAAGSIVAYALGITDIDPLRFGLIFERFFNAGREEGLPDIDNDFPTGDRKAVKEYLVKRWGKDKVRAIGNITRMKPKAALDKTHAAMGVTFGEKEELKKIVNTVPDLEILDTNAIGWRDKGEGKTVYVIDHVGRDIQKWLERQPQDRQTIIQRWLDFVDVVCSRVSGYGVHASGVVISDVPLDAELPSGWSASQETQATWFPMRDVEARQFVKQDILGLRTLDTLQDWHRQIKAKGIDVRWSGLEEKEHPEEMWKMIDKGLTVGLFQIEDKPKVKKIAMDLKPRNVEELGLLVALNRPGPLRSGAPESFIVRRNGGQDEEFDGRKIKVLEGILDETYGWFVYQEQVIRFFERVGYSVYEADAIRSILGKKKPVKMRELRDGKGEWEGKGFFSMMAKAGVDDGLAHTIWAKLEDFAKYSFNKSHAVAYGTLTLRTLYAKYFAPAEFIMACIRTNPDDAHAYVAEGRRLRVYIRPPDIRYSSAEVEVDGSNIYYGLANIKGIGLPTAHFIQVLAKRYDVSTKADLTDALAIEQLKWESRRDAAKKAGEKFDEKSPKSQLKSNIITLLERIGCFDNYEERDISLSDRQKAEHDLLGIILSDNTEEAFQNNADLIQDCDDYETFLDANSDCKARLPGIVTKVRKTKTRAAGNEMGIVTIEYGVDQVEFAVFPQQWKAYRWLWKERTPGIFQVKKTDRGMNFEEGMKIA